MWIVLVRKILLSLKGRISDEKNSQLSTKHFNPAIHKTFQPKHFGQKKKKNQAGTKKPTVADEAQRQRSAREPSLLKLNGDAQSSSIATLSSQIATLRARRSRRSELADRDSELADRDALSSLIATLSSQIATLRARRSRRC